MTANAMAGDLEICLASGMNDHVGKPFDMAQLVSLLIRTTGFTPNNVDRNGAPPERSPPGALSIPGLDVDNAILRLSGLKSLYVQIARDFSRELGSVVAELRALLGAGEYPQARMLLHTLKGNAGTLGATALAQEAGRLETMYAVPAPDTEPPPLAVLETLVLSTIVSLSQAIEALDPA